MSVTRRALSALKILSMDGSMESAHDYEMLLGLAAITKHPKEKIFLFHSTNVFLSKQQT
jgi:hypothetical protein